MAASLSLSTRRLRQILQESKTNGEADHHVDSSTGRALEDVLIDVFPNEEDPVSFHSIQARFPSYVGCVFDEEQLRSVVNNAIQHGYVCKVGKTADSPDGTQLYRWTGKRYVYPTAATPSQRHQRSQRAWKIVSNAGEPNKFEISGKVTAEGFERLVEYLTPDTYEANTYELLQVRTKQSKKRLKDPEVHHEANCGAVLALGPGEPGTNAVCDVLIDHENPDHCVLPSMEYLDDEAAQQFLNEDFGQIIEQARQIMNDAEQLGEGVKTSVVLTVAASRFPCQRRLSVFAKACVALLLVLCIWPAHRAAVSRSREVAVTLASVGANPRDGHGAPHSGEVAVTLASAGANPRDGHGPPRSREVAGNTAVSAGRARRVV